MPTLTIFEGIKINVYFGEHLPPHIHAIYNEYEVLLKIKDSEIYEGHLPSKQLRKSQYWVAENRSDLLNAFYELNPHLKNEERNKKHTKNNKNK